MKVEGLGVSMLTDKATYAAGDTIALKLSVLNTTEEKVTFHFSDAQRYDFVVEDQKGKKIWRWSEGRMFAQVLGEETLGPGREELSYTASYKGALEHGSYQITGILVAKDRPMSASVSVVAK